MVGYDGLFILTTECLSKRDILLDAYKNEPPEATKGPIGRVLFLWINQILVRGYRKILQKDDLPLLDHYLSSRNLRQTILRVWDQRAKPENGATVPRVLLKCLQTPFLAAIVPRIFVVLFRFAQPLLISRAIRFVTSSPEEDERLNGYWIVVAASLIYIGMAVSTSIYKHRLNRLEVMIRGAMVSLLHHRVLIARNGESEDGKVVTLISNDMSNVEKSAEMFHETWAQFVEVIVGTMLLAREVGRLWPVPFVLIFCCSQMSRYVTKHLKAEQGKWNTATQQRISATSSMLASIKNIKMLGFQEAMVNHIEDLRRQEMDAARGVRWLMVAYNASANALGMFAPVLTIVLYAGLAMLRGAVLDAETAFTTVAILSMITHPANMIMTIVPRAVVSYASFERIQEYLLDDNGPSRAVDMSKHSRNPAIMAHHSSVDAQLSVVTVSSARENKPILRDINLEIRQGTITICTGPVGSGKTTLARAILGELSPSQGYVRLFPRRVAYCAQTPWLPNQSIREVICGPTADHESQDETWYQTTIRACCLDSDIELLPYGDATMVGSNGMNLSGGQRQRVALARAVYSRYDMAILDDSFNALDEKTQLHVVENLLGPSGILRKNQVTVLWITSATRYFGLTDEIIVLADGTVKEKGRWEQLRKDDPLIDKIIHSNDGVFKTAVKDPEKSDMVRDSKNTTSVAAAQDLSRRNGDFSLYSYYFTSAGISNVVAMIFCTACCSFFNNIPQYWLKRWTEPTSTSTHTSTTIYMAVYLLLLIIAWLFTNGMMYTTILKVAPTSGLTLHHRLLTTILSAPLLYFSHLDIGTILNRFGQDIQLIDKTLAPAASSFSVQAFKLINQTILLCASQPILSLSLPLGAVVVYLVQRVYLRTSRQLRLLELESRAAVVSGFLEAVQGAATIRAFGWQGVVAGQHDGEGAAGVLDGYQRPSYLLLCLQRWLSIVLDLLVAGIAVVSVRLAVSHRGSTTGGQVGLALNMILVANATLLRLVESWTELEISLGAVARLKEVETLTPREDKPGEEEEYDEPRRPDNWPTRGRIQLKDVTASYNPTAIALRNIDLNIEAGQTVVICGRTGSGKSSLLLALLKLLDTTDGVIAIDDIDTAPLSRRTIRQEAFITVAQEPFFLPHASLRFNLDPEMRARPAVLVAVLKRTGLPFSFLPALSAGQTQLLALARALVRRSILCDPLSSLSTTSSCSDSKRAGARPVILLDEVTSSLDPVTESKIHDIISEEFVHNGHTVVMVTHKLNAVRGILRSGKDVVVRMAEGRIEQVEVIG
ncbi:Multidrug resistance-associated protein 1 [Cytospora mali]|uniref:Multidrug resistance-associated protein 1 n=1 Tax=Cytospora mali TaxID=578113 RepID=A0A194UZS4_CYTMA|nr:Multidrug resistance-associated protein 1 [Valsa mali var. pyri (nom. inval.)]